MTNKTLLAAAVAIFPTTVLQSYFLGIGLGYEEVALYGTIGNVISASIMILLPGVADFFTRFSAFKRANFVVLVGLGINYLAMYAIQLFAPDKPAAVIFSILLAACAVCALFIGVNAIFDAETLVRVGLNGNGIAQIMGLCGVISSGVSIASSAVVTFFTSSPALNAYCWLPGLASGAAIVSALTALSYVRVNWEIPRKAKLESPLRIYRDILGMRQFRLLLAPNILRSFGDSVVFFVISTGLIRFSGQKGAVGSFTIAVAVGNMLGNLLITLLHRKAGTARLYILSALATGAGLVCACMTASVHVYALLIVPIYTGDMIVGTVFPLAVYEYVPARKISSFTALRIFTLNLLNGFFVYLFGLALNCVSYLPLCILGLAAFAIGGYLFYRACAQMEKVT